MGNGSIKPPKYVEEPAEVYLSYTTSEGVEITEERVYLDIAVETVNVRLHLYDVIDKWVLALPGAYHELSSIVPGELTNWRKFVEDELAGTTMLKELKLLTRCSTRCTVKLKNKFGVSKFDSYLTRNLYSLTDEGVYALEADTLNPVEYPGAIPTKATNVEDFSDPDSYFSLINPLLWDVRILAEEGYIAHSKDYALMKYDGKVVLRLLCSGSSIRKIPIPNRDQEDFYTLALLSLREFLLKLFLTNSYTPSLHKITHSKVHEMIKDIIAHYVNYMEDVGYNQAVGQITRLSKRHTFVNCELTGFEPEISSNWEERTVQLLEATSKLAQSKKYIVGLFYKGVDILHKDGQILANSVKNGGDYMLRLMSLTPDRLTTFLSYAEPATKLLLASVYTTRSNPIAFEYILVHDTREGRENSISYKKLVERLQIGDKNIFTGKDVFKSTYINYVGPMYQFLLKDGR